MRARTSDFAVVLVSFVEYRDSVSCYLGPLFRIDVVCEISRLGFDAWPAVNGAVPVQDCPRLINDKDEVRERLAYCIPELLWRRQREAAIGDIGYRSDGCIRDPS